MAGATRLLKDLHVTPELQAADLCASTSNSFILKYRFVNICSEGLGPRSSEMRH